MQENKLIIHIARPVAKVFEFTINPANTPKWIDSIVEETTDGKEIKVGTWYTNKDREGKVNLYEVSKFENDKIFELQSIPPNYTVRYTYTSLSPEETELEYHEWVNSGELSAPFEQSNLDKLKTLLES
jgi:hypothetical protein